MSGPPGGGGASAAMGCPCAPRERFWLAAATWRDTPHTCPLREARNNAGDTACRCDCGIMRRPLAAGRPASTSSLGCQSCGSCFSAACAQPRRTDTTSPACPADLTARGSRVSEGELCFAAAAPATRRVSRGRQHQPVRAPSQLACRRRRVTQSSKLGGRRRQGGQVLTPPDTRRRTPCWRRAAPARRPAARRRRRWTWRCGGGCSCCAGAARGAFVPVAHCTAEFLLCARLRP